MCTTSLDVASTLRRCFTVVCLTPEHHCQEHLAPDSEAGATQPSTDVRNTSITACTSVPYVHAVPEKARRGSQIP